MASGEAYQYFLNGEYELLNQNFIEAERNYTKALSISPDSPTILQSLADVQFYQGNYEKAAGYLEKIHELSPGDKETGLQLFQILRSQENTHQAGQIIDTLIYYNPRDKDLLYSKADLHFSTQNWPSLLQTYKLIYLMDQVNTQVLLKLHEIGLATGELEKVIEVLTDIFEKTNKINVLELLIQAIIYSGEHEAAIPLLKNLISRNGNEAYENIQLSELYLQIGEFESALNTLLPLYDKGDYSIEILRVLLVAYSKLEDIKNQVIISQVLLNEYPEMPIGYEALSYAYIDGNQMSKALEILLNGISKFPEKFTFPYSLGTLFYKLKKYNKAEEYYLGALAIQPEYTPVKHALAMLYEDKQNTAQADSLFLMMIEENEEDAVGLNDYAYIICERRDVSGKELNYALEFAIRAVDLNPDNAAFLDTIGWIYFKLGQFKKAEKNLEKSLSINNDNPVILEHLGDIYLKLNKLQEAEDTYKKVLKIDADNTLVADKIKLINDR